jgi:arginase family enzyme
MPLAMLVGRGEQTLVNAVSIHPLPETQVILTDGRDLDPEEQQALIGSKVHHLPDPHALLEHPLISHPLYIHFDTDIINPKEAPAMSYLAQCGPSAAELQALFRSLAQTGQIIAVSMTTWNPRLDSDGHSQVVSMALLRALIDQ